MSRWIFCGLMWLGLLSGCHDTGPKLVPVSGRITLDGKPLPRGSVSLRTEEHWEQPAGSIDADGQYVVYTQGRAGVPPGHYRVVVFATEAARDADGKAHPGLPVSIIPATYNDPQQTPLEIDVTLSSRAPFNLEFFRDVPK